MVKFASIHLKTRRHGGAAKHGYPDPGYLDRVSQELDQHGLPKTPKQCFEALLSSNLTSASQLGEVLVTPEAAQVLDGAVLEEVEPSANARSPSFLKKWSHLPAA